MSTITNVSQKMSMIPLYKVELSMFVIGLILYDKKLKMLMMKAIHYQRTEQHQMAAVKDLKKKLLKK